MCGTETMVCGEKKSYVHTRPVCGTCKSSKVFASKRLRAGADTMARIWGGHGDWQIENTQMRVVRSNVYGSSVQVGIVPNHLTGCTFQLNVFVHTWIIRTKIANSNEFRAFECARLSKPITIPPSGNTSISRVPKRWQEDWQAAPIVCGCCCVVVDVVVDVVASCRNDCCTVVGLCCCCCCIVVGNCCYWMSGARKKWTRSKDTETIREQNINMDREQMWKIEWLVMWTWYWWLL